jgi:polysaccharide biosynthesis transport protein
MKEAGISVGLKASNIRVVDSADPPRRPAKPNVPLNLALGLVMGLGLGVGAAFLQEHLDNTLKTSSDVERFLQLPALALIPSASSQENQAGLQGLYRRKLGKNGDSNLANGHDRSRVMAEATNSFSALAEAFRGLRTSVLLSSAKHPPRSLLVTSALPGEGKTTVSINLAVSLAQLGKRVLLIDCDLRRPSIHEAFDLQRDEGVVNYLTGQRDWRELAARNGTAHLDVLPCGPVPPDPAELLSSDAMQALVREATDEYDFVVIDSPPILNVADSRILATHVDGVVLVINGGVTTRDMVQRAQAQANEVGANVIGVVLNNVDARGDSYGYYGYKGYGPDEQSGKKEA